MASAPSHQRQLTVAFDGPHAADSAAAAAATIAECQASDESNACCADCRASAPTWASFNIGVFICTLCAGVHRSLGTHVSKVRSCVIDQWSAEHIAAMQAHTNEHVNVRLEYHVPRAMSKPRPDSARDVRERFIRAKYEAMAFVKTDAALPPLDAEFDASPPLSHETETDAAGSGSESIHSPHASEAATAQGRMRGANSSAGMVEYAGMLSVRLHSARGLKKADLLGLSDPYAVIEAKPATKQQVVRSRVVNECLDPVWNEVLNVMIERIDRQSLHIAVFDQDAVGQDDFLGECNVNLSDPQNFGCEMNVPLSVQGSIQLTLEYSEIAH
jgi:hypothetical protein